MHLSIKPVLAALAFGAVLAPVAGIAGERISRDMVSVHQPVVSHTVLTFAIRVDAGGRLIAGEAKRFDGWLSSIHLGYGDQIALATDADGYPPVLRESVGDVVGRYGLLLADDPAIDPGEGAEGLVRVLVRRATASVPGCPEWTTNAESFGVGTSSNFGCAVNSNLAAMVADPLDLVEGQAADSDLRTATSTRAIQTYMAKTPTGNGDLKQLSGGGSN